MKTKNVKLILLSLFCVGLTGLRAQTVNDVESNIYKTVKIGNQTWMAENLKTTKFNDGTAIPLVLDNKAWNALTSPAYCWFNNDSAVNKNIYGGLYNWYAVNSKKLCPMGWHIPSDAEWTTLITFLGGENVAGGKLKESGTVHWKTSGSTITNETGFSALPGGSRVIYGKWGKIRSYGTWWSATEKGTGYSLARTMDKSSKVFKGNYYQQSGFSVRCLKDN